MHFWVSYTHLNSNGFIVRELYREEKQSRDKQEMEWISLSKQENKLIKRKRRTHTILSHLICLLASLSIYVIERETERGKIKRDQGCLF